MEVKKNEVKRKSLNPQAADYYKRLILVTDRFLLQVKKNRNLRMYSWAITILALAEMVIIVTKVILE